MEEEKEMEDVGVEKEGELVDLEVEEEKERGVGAEKEVAEEVAEGAKEGVAEGVGAVVKQPQHGVDDSNDADIYERMSLRTNMWL